MNHKKLFRLYREEGLSVRKRGGRKWALGTRSPMMLPDGPNQRWSLDFVSDGLNNRRWWTTTRANASSWWRIRRCQANGSAANSTGSENIAAGGAVQHLRWLGVFSRKDTKDKEFGTKLSYSDTHG